MADEKGSGKIAFEAKMKSSFSGTVHETSVKQDGTLSYEFKWDILDVSLTNLYIINYRERLLYNEECMVFISV